MGPLKKSLIGILFCSSAAFPQSVSFGLRGGVPLTDAFSDATYQGVDFTRHIFSNSKAFAVGPLVELNLPLGFSIEADALYRRLNLTTVNRVIPQQSVTISNGYSSWEFPVLGKLRVFPLPFVKPYVEAGPTFRTTGSSFNNFSKAGFTAGVGVELKLFKIRISPDIRYTRYGSDSKPGSIVNFLATSNVNQAEFLIGLSF